jgi:hypothetical protein
MTEMLYTGTKARVETILEPDCYIGDEFDFDGITMQTRGVVWYEIEELIDGKWMTAAQMAAPIFDVALRTTAATEALRLADEIEGR